MSYNFILPSPFVTPYSSPGSHFSSPTPNLITMRNFRLPSISTLFPELIAPRPDVLRTELPNRSVTRISNEEVETPQMVFTKAKRTRLSSIQLYRLHNTFASTKFPSTETRRSLALELGLSPRTVQIWFQNKRQTEKSRSYQF